MKADALTREQKRTALELYRMDASGDPWGDSMCHLFAVADILHHAGEYVGHDYRHPMLAVGPYCGYEPECGGVWPEVEYYPLLDAGELGIQILAYAYRALDRYAGWVKRAGLDY